MTQTELNRRVAQATGEDLRTIARHGFSVADPATASYDPEPSRKRPCVVDWDRLQAQRTALFARRQRRESLLA